MLKWLDLLPRFAARIQESFGDSICVCLMRGRVRQVNVHCFHRELSSSFALKQILANTSRGRVAQNRPHVP